MFPTSHFLCFPTLKHFNIAQGQSKPVLRDYSGPPETDLPKTLYKLQWGNLDSIFKRKMDERRVTSEQDLPQTSLPIKYHTWVEGFILNLSEDAKEEVRRLTYCAVAEASHRSELHKNRHLGDALDRPQYAYIQAAFKILSDCLYDVKKNFFYREDDKYIATYAMLVRFWFSQQQHASGIVGVPGSSEEIWKRSDIQSLDETILWYKHNPYSDTDMERFFKIGEDFVAAVSAHIDGVDTSELLELKKDMKEVGKCTDSLRRSAKDVERMKDIQERQSLPTITVEYSPDERAAREKKWTQEEFAADNPGVSVEKILKDLGLDKKNKFKTIEDVMACRVYDPVIDKEGTRMPTEFNTVVDDSNEKACKEAVESNSPEVYNNLASALEGNKEPPTDVTTLFDDVLSALSMGEDQFLGSSFEFSVGGTLDSDNNLPIDFIWEKAPTEEEMNYLLEKNPFIRANKDAHRYAEHVVGPEGWTV